MNEFKENSPQVPAQTAKENIKDAYAEILKEIERILTEEGQSEFLLQMEVDEFIKAMIKTGDESYSEELITYFREEYDKFSKEVKEFRELFESYKLDGLFTLSLKDSLTEISEAYFNREAEKDLQKKKDKIISRLEGENFIFDQLPAGIKVDQGEYRLESQFKVNFYLDGVKVDLWGNEALIRDYGDCILIDKLSLNDVPITIMEKNHFDLRSGEISKIVEAFKKLENPGPNVIYSPQLRDFLLPQDENVENENYSYRQEDRDMVVFDKLGEPLFRQINDKGQKNYRIYNKSGHLIPSFEEWKGDYTNEKIATNEFMSKLARELKSDDRINLYMSLMFKYTSDSPNQSLYTSTTNLGLIDLGILMKENWQFWQETVKRVDQNGQHLGDCDDYAIFLKKLLQLQGKNPEVLLLPAHATTIWAEKTEKGYIMRDCGTFNLLKVEGETLEECLQKIYDRYQQSGLGVWQGNRLSANKHKIEIAEIESNRGKKQRREYSMPLECLVNAELASDFKYFQDKLHRYFAEERLPGQFLFVKREFERLQNKYREKWYEFFSDEKFPILKLYQAALSNLEGDRDNVRENIEDYIKSSGQVTQEVLENLWKIIRNRDREKGLAKMLDYLSKSPYLSYSPVFNGLISEAIMQDKLTELMKIFDEKCGEQDKSIIYMEVLNQMNMLDFIDEKIFEDISELIFKIKNKEIFTILKRDMIFLCENISPEKHLEFVLGLMEIDPTEKIFSLELLRALLRNNKSSTVTYLINNL